MIPIHFSLGFVEFLARHRVAPLTWLMQGASLFGGAESYILLVMLIYVAWDKRLAVRLSFLILATMAFNDILKSLIRNPRPFIGDGSWREKWAVFPREANILVTEYSTPSGHAMGAASFYSYLFAFVRRRSVRIFAVAAILLIGFSRPYLGVHYGEDVLIGWAIGLAMALAAARYTHALAVLWGRCPYALQIAFAGGASFAFCLLSVTLNDGRVNGQLHGVAAYAGFFTGNAIACPLELRRVRFDPSSGTAAARLARFGLTAALVGVVLTGLKFAFAKVAPENSCAWFALEYLRYTAGGVCGMLTAPWLFTRMKLARTLPH